MVAATAAAVAEGAMERVRAVATTGAAGATMAVWVVALAASVVTLAVVEVAEGVKRDVCDPTLQVAPLPPQ